jgi:phosphomannomutase/phosphoglucomutase
MKYPKEIFKAYDIRGVVDKTLTENVVTDIGQALGSMAKEKGIERMVISRDGRLSGPALAKALSQGLQKAGMKVIDIGMVPTPVLYFATFHLETGSGIAITGSHNPPEYNGLKIMLGGDTLYGPMIQAIYERLEQGNLLEGQGSYEQVDVREAYLSRIASDIHLKRPLHIAIDCGNGVPGNLAPELYRRLGCTVDELFCEVDGTFPNHHPDPSRPENLNDLIAHLQKSDAEVGLAFDGDGDRLGVVTKSGKIIFSDRQLMLFAEDLLSRHPGATIIFDVKSTAKLAPWIEEHGGVPLLWKTGHSFIKSKMKETGALLAGEMSGHIFFKERWYGFDDGLYAGARLIEILSRYDDTEAVFNRLPEAINTPELRLELSEGEQYAFIEKMQQEAKAFAGAERVIDIDGLRVEYRDGFGLMRASNTTPTVIFRFEGESEEVLKRIQETFRKAISQVFPHIKLPF